MMSVGGGGGESLPFSGLVAPVDAKVFSFSVALLLFAGNSCLAMLVADLRLLLEENIFKIRS